MKAFREIGLAKSLKFVFFTIIYVIYRGIPIPQLRAVYLRILGAKIGRNTIIHDVRFFNYYRTGFSGLSIGQSCFIGNETLLDLAAPIRLEDNVTLAERVLVLTHINVGYGDHPLQAAFPARERPVVIRAGSFVGSNATILDGIEIGPKGAVAAGALVTENVPPSVLVGGVPAKKIRDI